jgi:hypothetical protein
LRIVKEIIFVVIFTFAFIFLSSLIYTLSGRNHKTLFRWVKVTLLISTIISLILCIIKLIILNRFDCKDTTFLILIFCLFFDLVDFSIIALTNRIYKHRRVFKNEVISNKLISLCTFSLIVIPIFIVSDVIFLIFPNLLL